MYSGMGDISYEDFAAKYVDKLKPNGAAWTLAEISQIENTPVAVLNQYMTYAQIQHAVAVGVMTTDQAAGFFQPGGAAYQPGVVSYTSPAPGSSIPGPPTPAPVTPAPPYGAPPPPYVAPPPGTRIPTQTNNYSLWWLGLAAAAFFLLKK